MDKVALITGITGQDGSYLAENLLKNGYKVIGLKRRTSTNNLTNLKKVINDIEIVEGDLADPISLFSLLTQKKPTHIFNLAAQSHVTTSFSQPLYTLEVTGNSPLYFLEYIKNYSPSTRFYQASSSEMFGDMVSFYYDVQGCTVKDHCRFKNLKEESSYNNRIGEIYDSPQNEYDGIFQDEETPFCPQSPYSIAKLAAHNLVRLYRESYGLFCCSGILFNHESERRGELFVTQKIAKYVRYLDAYRGTAGTRQKLKLGNLNAYRDWGHAEDYVEAMRLILNNDKPVDYVVSTGNSYSVLDFAKEAFFLINENWEKYVEIDPTLFRPAEVPFLKGNSIKIRKELGWSPKISFHELVKRMVFPNE